MAPQNKRATVSKSPVPAKKAKVTVADAALASVLAALSESDVPQVCCDMLRSALPHCLGDALGCRHSFQTEVLDFASAALRKLEDQRRASLAEAEGAVSALREEESQARTASEAARALATAQKNESEKKSAELASLKAEVEAASAEAKAEAKKKDAFLVYKASLIQDQEAFENVRHNIWQPLKAAAFTGKEWRKRDKLCAELFQKIKPLGLSQSLIDALLLALKQKPDQRGTFALTALDWAEKAFDEHATRLAERVATAPAEEDARTQAVAAAEAKHGELSVRYGVQDKEGDELQNAWAELETSAKEAEKAVSLCQGRIKAAVADVEARKAALDDTLTIEASFAALKDPPAPPHQDLEQPQAELLHAEPQVETLAAAA